AARAPGDVGRSVVLEFFPARRTSPFGPRVAARLDVLHRAPTVLEGERRARVDARRLCSAGNAFLLHGAPPSPQCGHRAAKAEGAPGIALAALRARYYHQRCGEREATPGARAPRHASLT